MMDAWGSVQAAAKLIGATRRAADPAQLAFASGNERRPKVRHPGPHGLDMSSSGPTYPDCNKPQKVAGFSAKLLHVHVAAAHRITFDREELFAQGVLWETLDGYGLDDLCCESFKFWNIDIHAGY